MLNLSILFETVHPADDRRTLSHTHSMENSNYKLLLKFNDMQNIHFIFHANEFIMGIVNDCPVVIHILDVGKYFVRLKIYQNFACAYQIRVCTVYIWQNANKLILITLNAENI